MVVSARRLLRSDSLTEGAVYGKKEASMRKFVVVKVGRKLPGVIARPGDFEDWIVAGLGSAADQVSVIDVRRGAALPDYDAVAGVVVTGSHAMVTDHAVWSERTARWLPGLIERRIPVLGICYGHQLLAYALGGHVGYNPRGREYGTVAVHLEETACSDPLLAGFSPPLLVHASHRQAVLRLPDGARRLAFSARDAHHAFAVGEAAWGVQFHPEFDADTVRGYVHHSQDALAAEGQDPQALAAACVDTPYGTELLLRFAGVVRGGRER